VPFRFKRIGIGGRRVILEVLVNHHFDSDRRQSIQPSASSLWRSCSVAHIASHSSLRVE
jgi:hypothetical protein